ncbi:MAG: prepilin-type N-terminal cleavage/methylation domain-containing protein [Alphaproteobacteria bacterium]|nr:prepilin-type N-terminal cleavage/methylation domain-containing protein [Alphaproteobacteria bacterium]
MRRARERGVSLVEMLVALVVIGAVAASLASVLELSLLAGNRADARFSESERGAGAALTLRRLLQTALPAPANSAHVVFRGDRDSLLFVAPGLKRAGAVSLFEYRVELVEERDGTSLVLSYAPILPPVPGVAPPQRGHVTLLRGLGEARLSYAGEGSWRDAWSEPGLMPQAVRFAYAFKGEAVSLVFPVEVSSPLRERRRRMPP